MTLVFQKIIAFFFSILFALFPSLAGPAPEKGTYEVDNDKVVVCLDSNQTTGYTWSVEVSDENVIAYVSKAYASDKSSLIGSGGTDTFVFKSVGQGEFTVQFTYEQSWKADSAVEVRLMKGSVDSNGAITVDSFE